MRNHWVYVKTAHARADYQDAQSVRAEVLDHRSIYRVRMPDGEEREVTDDDLVFDRREQDPTTEMEVEGRAGDPEMKAVHPSFGMIGISRTSGSRPIFGSKVGRHHHYVTLTITRGAEVTHGLGMDWFFAGGTVIEVALSEARYAEMISAPNMGSGVPCSIEYHSPVPGPGMIPATPLPTEGARIVSRVRRLGQEAEAQRQESRRVLEETLAKVPEKTRKAALAAFDRAGKVLTDTTPFLVSQATEAIEKRASEAKAEIEAMVSSAVHRAGVRAIEGDSSELTRGLIGIRKENDEDENNE